MNRIFVLFLVCLLPLQSAWAALGDYCASEAGPSSLALGHQDHAVPSWHVHHDHQNHASELPQFNDVLIDADLPSDCGACHGHFSAAAISFITLASPQPRLPAFSALETPAASVTQVRPERPNWMHPA